MSQRISACYFPTRILLVDDKASYLKSLERVLDKTTAVYETYTDPALVLAYLSKDYKAAHLIEKIISYPESHNVNHRNIQVDIAAIHQEIYNPDRFEEISVLAIDYSMPGLTGSQVCEKVKGSPYKKMMLTGEADNKLAIDLLNRRIIDQFIDKGNPNFLQLTNQSAKKLQKEYFVALTQLVIDSLIYSKEHLRCLQESEYLNLFDSLFKESQGVEYYLLDNSGSFLFLTTKAQPSYFVLRSEEDMQAAENLLSSSAQVPLPLLESIQRREKLLFFPSGNPPSSGSPSWELSAYPAKKLITSTGTYYYSYIKEPSAFDIDTSKIVSFDHYLKEHDKF